MARKERFLIDSRVLILFLILGIPPLVVGHLILVNGTQERFAETVGSSLSNRTDGLQTQLVGYIEKFSMEVANLGAVPVVQAVVREANQKVPSEADFATQLQELEAQWAQMTPGQSRFLADILENRASSFLQDYNRVVASFREILVTDRYGRLVAASSKVSDYFQADENWWRVAYLEGAGQRFISDVVYDDSARVYCIEVAEPIRESATNEVIGIIKTIIDSDTLFGLFGSSRFKENLVAVLIRENGSVVTDPTSGESYPFTETIRTEMSRNRAYVAAPAEAPRVFLGLPTFSVKDRIPELDWTLVLQAPYDEVFSPFRNLKSWFLYIVIFSVALVIILAFVFSWILSKPIVETDPHLDRV